MAEDIDARVAELAEAVIDQLNRDAETADSPVMLSSFVFIVEGNGITPDGGHLTRGYHTYHGSSSQVRGLLAETDDDVRGQDL